MVDVLKREITFSEELLERVELVNKKVKVNIFYDHELKRLLILPDYEPDEKHAFVASAEIGQDGKMDIPEVIRGAFQKETFLPVCRHKNLSIFIIG